MPFLMVLALFQSGSAAQVDPPAQPLAPSTNWGVGTDETICVARRSFGPSTASVALQIGAAPLSAQHVMTLGLPKPIKVNYRDPVRLRLQPGGRTEQATVFGFAPGASTQRVIAFHINRAALEAGTVSSAQVDVREKVVADLELGDPSAMLSALNNCERGLLRKFGVQPDENAAVAEPARPAANQERWFPPDLYPQQAIKAGAQGTVGARFKVMEDGSLADCVTVLSSGSKVLDAVTCDTLLSKARYSPARDRSGAAIRSTQLLFTRWTLPRR